MDEKMKEIAHLLDEMQEQIKKGSHSMAEVLSMLTLLERGCNDECVDILPMITNMIGRHLNDCVWDRIAEVEEYINQGKHILSDGIDSDEQEEI